MDSTNRILSFEEFVKQGTPGDDSMGSQTDMPTMDVPSTDSDLDGQSNMGDMDGMTSDSPVPAQTPASNDTEHNVPVHMMDDETGEAEAEVPAEPNVQIEEPTGSDVK